MHLVIFSVSGRDYVVIDKETKLFIHREGLSFYC